MTKFETPAIMQSKFHPIFDTTRVSPHCNIRMISTHNATINLSPLYNITWILQYNTSLIPLCPYNASLTPLPIQHSILLTIRQRSIYQGSSAVAIVNVHQVILRRWGVPEDDRCHVFTLRRQRRGRCWRRKRTTVLHSRIEAWHLNTAPHTHSHNTRTPVANWAVPSRSAGSPSIIHNLAHVNTITMTHILYTLQGVPHSDVITGITEEAMSLHKT